MDQSDRWVPLAFTWTGLRALDVPEDALASCPDPCTSSRRCYSNGASTTPTTPQQRRHGALRAPPKPSPIPAPRTDR